MISTKWFYGSEGLDDAHYIRRKVFMEEQSVSEEEEMDGTDENAAHIVVYEGDAPVACGRMLNINGDYVLGRIAVLKEHRKKGYGDLVMRMLIRKAFNMGASKQHVHAQISARGFYEKLGFTAYGDEYLDARIPHINMVHDGDIGGCC